MATHKTLFRLHTILIALLWVVPLHAVTDLPNGVPVRWELPAVSAATLFTGDQGFRVVMPEAPALLEIRLVTDTPGVDVDLYVRYNVEPEVQGGRVISDHSSASFSANESVTIRPTTTPPLREGSYFIALRVLTTGRATSGTLTATYNAGPPRIGLSLTTLNFIILTGPNRASQSFQIRNTGGGTLQYSFATQQPWITFSPARGDSTTENDTISVTVNAQGLASAVYNGQIQVSGTANTTTGDPVPGATVAVRLTVTPATSPAISSGGIVSAATGVREAAAGSIASVFGQRLANNTLGATAIPLPTTLGGATVKVTDSRGVERLAPLFFVSPAQINCLIPEDTATGSATVTIDTGELRLGTATVTVVAVSPGVFTANADGKGVPAALLQRISADGSPSTVLAFRCTGGAGTCVPDPLDLGGESDQAVLILFATGIRGRSDLRAVTARLGGETLEVLYAGPQGGFVGLDQINLRLPRFLLGLGEGSLQLTVDSRSANSVTVNIGGTAPPPRVTSLVPPWGAQDQTFENLTFNGEFFRNASAIEFNPPDGITVSNMRAASTSLRARLAIAGGTRTGLREVTCVTPSGRSNPVSFEVRPRGVAPVISNVSVGSPSIGPGGLAVATGRFNFVDPDGDLLFSGALEGSAQVEFRANIGLRTCTVRATSASLHRPGQTSGTVDFVVAYGFSSLTIGTGISVEFTVIDAAGNRSNTISFSTTLWLCRLLDRDAPLHGEAPPDFVLAGRREDLG